MSAGLTRTSAKKLGIKSPCTVILLYCANFLVTSKYGYIFNVKGKKKVHHHLALIKLMVKCCFQFCTIRDSLYCYYDMQD